VRSWEMVKHETNDGDKAVTEWFKESVALTMINQGWSYTGKVRTEYAEPDWVTTLKSKEYSILNLDDFSRADIRFQQAIMQLIQNGTYYGWSLPKGCTIILTSNPDDGDYIVTSQDKAM